MNFYKSIKNGRSMTDVGRTGSQDEVKLWQREAELGCLHLGIL